MSVTCDRCGKQTRTVYPYMPKPAPTFDEALKAPLSRLALYVLDPEAEAALPRGAHPQDDDFGVCCAECAKEIA